MTTVDRVGLSEQNGLTLMELIVAMVVASLLAGISMRMSLGQRSRGEDSAATAVLRDAAMTVEVAGTASQGYVAIIPARVAAIDPGIHFHTTAVPRAAAGEVRVAVGVNGPLIDTISYTGVT
jgi:prepilin-type N-terminal cleavage/methylation domain-containing protein